MGGSIESLPTDAIELGVPTAVLDPYAPLWSKSSSREGVTLDLNPLPVLTLGSPRGLRVSFTSGFLLSMAILWVGGAMLWEFIAQTVDSEFGPLVGLSSMPTDIFSVSPVVFGLVFALGLHVSSLLYVLGHGVGYTLTGRYLAGISLGLSSTAHPSEDPKNSYQQLGTSLVGGFIQPLMGMAGLLMLGGPGWSVLQIVFLLMLIGGFFNLLIPTRTNSPSARFWVSLSRVIIGRGGRELSPRVS